MLNEGQKGLICMYTCCGGGYGFGHTSRLLNLTYSLRGYKIRFFIKGIIPDFVNAFVERGVEGIGGGMDVEIEGVEGVSEVIDYVNRAGPLVLIHDARDSKGWYIKELIKGTKVITLDDHGEGSVWVPIKINALPVVEKCNELSRSNFGGFEYIILDEELKREGGVRGDVDSFRVEEEGVLGGGYELLVSFGGEDPYGLTRLSYEMLTKGREREGGLRYKLKIVLGPLYRGESNFVKADKVYKGLSRSEYISELKGSDVVITSFGMTVYEGLYLRKRVYTLNPTKYHNNLSKELSKELGAVKTLGVLNKGTNAFNKAKLLEELISSLNNELIKGVDFMCYEVLSLMGCERVGAVVEEVMKRSEGKCPICESHGRVYGREGYINSYYCYNCKSFYRSKGYRCEVEYSDRYFTSEYKAQYGRTYLDDKENINRFNRSRIKIIKELMYGSEGGGIFGQSDLSEGDVDVGDRGDGGDRGDRVDGVDGVKLLEIGSALGFFLELAKEELGAKCYGIELSSYGSRYANEELGLNVLQVDFSKFLCGGDIERSSKAFVMVEGGYDVLCGWYYLEHNADFAEVLGKMKKLLKQGGLLCLSTPNCFGISFKRDKSGYINKIPKDHYIEFSPWSLSKLLERIGFVIEHIEYRGLYFERVIRSKRYQKLLKVVRRPILYYYKRYGDTFEIYARKT